MRKCKKCREVKNLKEFYLNNKFCCKKCYMERVALWKKNNPERVEEMRATSIYKEKQSKYYRGWYDKHGRKRDEYDIEYSRLWKILNPKKARASRLARYAVATGKLKKPKKCSSCPNEQKLVGHHDDYEFPYAVRWLCHSCHKKEHLSTPYNTVSVKGAI